MATTYTVTGMTCGHCAGSVSDAIQKLDGVRDVQVDVATGQVTVTSDHDLPEDEVREAVSEAGYHLAATQ